LRKINDGTTGCDSYFSFCIFTALAHISLKTLIMWTSISCFKNTQFVKLDGGYLVRIQNVWYIIFLLWHTEKLFKVIKIESTVQCNYFWFQITFYVVVVGVNTFHKPYIDFTFVSILVKTSIAHGLSHFRITISVRVHF